MGHVIYYKSKLYSLVQVTAAVKSNYKIYPYKCTVKINQMCPYISFVVNLRMKIYRKKVRC